MPAPAFDSKMLQQAKEELSRAARAANITGIDLVGHVRIGSAIAEISTLAEDVDADLIVVGASSKGIAMRALLGSTAYGLVRHAPCSVIIARPRNKPEIEPRRADQDDDIHKRHHPVAHQYHKLPESFGMGSMSFRFEAS